MSDDKAAAAAAQLSELLKQGSGGPVSMEHAREAILIEDGDIPWVDLPDGSGLKVLQVDLNQNLWIVKNRLKPGFCIDTHYHTGPVFAFTESGEWYYKEYPNLVNKAGSFLYEPAHSVHTLTVSPDATEDAIVSFIVFGSNVNVDADGNVVSVLDAQKLYTVYKLLCEANGLNCDKTIVLG
jgi:quercetin dioxygenase-like cupin family protein